MAEEIDVPPYFLCPISLEIMKDPVTITTGITYDRENIEKWIFASKNKTCPVTKQPISQLDALVLTPNHTLRRLIQSWCCLNASYGIERFPTPKPPVSTTQITKLLNQARNCPHLRMTSLKELKSIAAESGANRRSLEASPGVMEYLSSTVVESSRLGTTEATATTDDDDDDREEAEVVVEEAGDDEVAGSGRKYMGDEALSILYLLQISESGLKTLGSQKDGIFIEALANILGQGNYASRAYAVKLMRSVLEVAEPSQLASLKPNLFTEVIQVIGDHFSSKSTKSALKLLIHILPWGRNRIRATEAGAVAVMIDHLIDSDTDKRSCEMMLMVLDQLCGSTAEGRAELLKHGAGLAVVSKRILRVSRFATEKAVKILFAISRFSATAAVLQEMLQFGVVNKLCLVLQVDSDRKTKDRARAILKSHAKAWRGSPCVPSSLAWAFPS